MRTNLVSNKAPYPQLNCFGCY